MADVPLSFSYWKSKFEYPHELSHVRLPQTLFPSQMDGQVVNWETLCHQLLRAVRDQFKWLESQKRISTLTRKLAQKLLFESTTNSSKGQEQTVGAGDLVCRSFLTCSGQSIANHVSAILEEWSSSGGSHFIAATFSSRLPRKTLAGIAFGGSEQTSYLGKCDERGAERFDFRYGEHLQSMIVGFTADGIVGLTVIVSKGTARDTTRTYTFGTFEKGVALGRLNPVDGSTVSGIKAGLSKVCHLMHRRTLGYYCWS